MSAKSRKVSWAYLGESSHVAVVEGYLVRVSQADEDPSTGIKSWQVYAHNAEHEWGETFERRAVEEAKAIAIRRAHGDESDPVALP